MASESVSVSFAGQYNKTSLSSVDIKARQAHLTKHEAPYYNRTNFTVVKFSLK